MSDYYNPDWKGFFHSMNDMFPQTNYSPTYNTIFDQHIHQAPSAACNKQDLTKKEDRRNRNREHAKIARARKKVTLIF